MSAITGIHRKTWSIRGDISDASESPVQVQFATLFLKKRPFSQAHLKLKDGT
jgi:hypothetical protein